MPVQPIDSLLAIKIIGLMPDLRPSDRRVAILIIEHYNRTDERCDPGIHRLSALLRLSTRTVMRALARLEKAGLIKRIRHGGYSHRNRYIPNWPRFAELRVAWNEQFKLAANARAANLSPSKRHTRHVACDSDVTQTYKANQHKQTLKDSRGSNRSLSPPTRVGRPPATAPVASKQAAATAAERRLSDDLHQQFASMPMTYGEIIQAIDADMLAAATEAEMKRRGGGVDHIIRALKLGRLR
jgi:DNA-binding transcriptional ArsR family regulator